jgi:chromosome segregation ATPase
VHILTKIFIVLVTLFAVAIVPLVATFVVNEDTFKVRWENTKSELLVTATRSSDAEKALVTERAILQQEIDARSATIAGLTAELASTKTTLETLHADRGQLQASLAQREANMQALSSASDVNSKIKERFVDENYELRNRVLQVVRSLQEIEDKLEESRQDFEVAEAAKRKAQEDRRRFEIELSSIQEMVDAYIARFGELETVAIASNGIAPDRTLTATVLAVSRNDNEVLAEINVGSRDGVKEGWIMAVGDGSSFFGRLQIAEVDINRSIGRISLESSDRGLVTPGAKVFATKGRN